MTTTERLRQTSAELREDVRLTDPAALRATLARRASALASLRARPAEVAAADRREAFEAAEAAREALVIRRENLKRELDELREIRRRRERLRPPPAAGGRLDAKG